MSVLQILQRGKRGRRKRHLSNLYFSCKRNLYLSCKNASIHQLSIYAFRATLHRHSTIDRTDAALGRNLGWLVGWSGWVGLDMHHKLQEFTKNCNKGDIGVAGDVVFLTDTIGALPSSILYMPRILNFSDVGTRLITTLPS